MAGSTVLRWRRPALFTATAAAVITLVVAARDVILPFVLALVIAYVLTPLVAVVERWGTRRAFAILLVYAAVLGLLGAFGRAIAPRIAVEVHNLEGELPKLAADAKSRWIPDLEDRMRGLGLAPPAPDPTDAPGPTGAFVARPLPDGTTAIDVGSGVVVSETKDGWIVAPARPREVALDPERMLAEALDRTFLYARHNSLELALVVRDFVARIARGVFVFFITLMLAAYLMLTRERVLGFFRSLVRPAERASFDSLVHRVDVGLSGVVRGQLVICGINGIASAIGFAIVGLKYWPVMALLAAVFSLVPIFGSIASAVPAVAIALTQGVGTAAFVLAWIVGIHQVEANVLNPKIMGDSAKIHPVLVIFALLVGEHFFHATGALLAVPSMSIAQSLFLHLLDRANSGDAQAEASSSS
jgi:predicted PurR-regulated permease PerM